VLRHHRDAEIVNAAVAASSGTATMHVSRDDNSSSLLAITDRQLEAFPRTEEIAAVEVRTVSLDEAVGESIERPALLKLDVQGSELEVLRGANRLLSAIDVVLVECSFEKFYADQPRAEHVVRFLHGRGFVLSGGTAPALDRRGVILQLDLIFTRARHDRPSAATT
jgi:FkbM family methyltransferase